MTRNNLSIIWISLDESLKTPSEGFHPIACPMQAIKLM
jgi:hypothetical protein